MNQTTNSILMIRPVAFRMNEQTAVNNYYQKVLDNLTPTSVNAGNYYGMVNVINTYQKKIVGNFPIAFLYQELTDIEMELQNNMKSHLTKALKMN